MQSASPSEIICPNPSCQARNPVGQTACSVCHTRLPLTVLYAPDLEDWKGPQGTRLVGDRYRWHGRGVFVDHKPGLVPDAPDDIPMGVAAYLRLFEQRPQVPVPYGQVKVGPRSFLLLEGAPVTLTGDYRLPHIRQEWSQATALRQLNWLWQIAQLWDPLQHLNCESTLLDAQKIRVEGSWIRLLSLDYRQSSKPCKVADLVRGWLGWSDRSHPAVTTALQHLLGQVIGEEITGVAIAKRIQDWAIQWAAAQPPCQTTVAAFTDPGPSRDRNEDACFPPSGQPASISTGDHTLAVVCDGLGGHDSGEVASMLAIQTFEKQLGARSGAALTPGTGTAAPVANAPAIAKILRQSFLDANHLISERNNQEAREDRHRMGTTAVVTLQEGRLLYAASLGDSRIYRLTANSCHQITLDDDLASREVRLGYGFYRDISQAPTGGALVQALGMGSSDYLSPGLRPLLLDEDCILLLCSDGISDFDFMERYWPDIYAYLDQGLSLDQVAQQLVKLATQVNGHDNTTVALVQIQGNLSQEQEVTLELAAPVSAGAILPQDETVSGERLMPAAANPNPAVPTAETTPTALVPGRSSPTTSAPTLPTQLPPPTPSSRRSPLLLSVILIGAGLLAALLWPSLRNLIEANRSQPAPPPSPTPVASPTRPPEGVASPTYTPGRIIQIATPLPSGTVPILRNRPRLDAEPTVNLGPLQTLIITEVTNTQDGTSLAAENWLKVSFCGPVIDPSTNSADVQISREPLVQGWIERSVLTAIAQPVSSPTPALQDACTYSLPQPLPSPATS